MLGQPVNYSRVVPTLVAAGAGFGLMLWADVHWGLMFNSSILYAAFLLLCLWPRDRRVLWPITAMALFVAFLAYFLEDGDARSLLNRCLNALAILAVAGVMHFLIGAWRKLEASETLLQTRAAELERANRELRMRESDIASQNEELQSQTEELERQSEELRVANDELAQRERTLETLLRLSRSLGMDLSPSETMNRVCETLGQLVNGAGTATAILLRGNDGAMNVRCHYGFGPDGIVAERIPDSESFAQLVFDQQRTGYLEDISLRPDLKVPQPVNGEPIVSVLAAPLIVRGKPIGTLEVYGRHRKSWSDEQVALAESLAAQAAISLENAELFAEIEAERRRLRAVLDTVPFGVAICDGECRRLIVNPAGAAMLHVPPTTHIAPLATDARWTVFRDGERMAPGDSPVVRAVQQGEHVDGEELEVVFSNGRRIFVLASAAPIRDASEKIIGGVAAWADITVLKTLQRELDLRRREAEEASVRKTRFLAAASHDIRTPANAISLIAELIKRTADNPKMAGEIPELAQEMHASAMSLVNLVTNVLDVTRFESGKLELQESEFPLAALLEEEVRQTLPLAQAKGLELELQEPPASLWLLSDRVKLGRVLGNLLGNAIKFTDRGAVRVTARRTEAGGAELKVSDTGIGISAEHQEKIFDEFFQLFDPQRSKGSGLGLAISKRLVEALGGTLTVASTPGNGSTFTVTLPPTCVARRDEHARTTAELA